jgi:uncharacterized heparinase superfamily protein
MMDYNVVLKQDIVLIENLLEHTNILHVIVHLHHHIRLVVQSESEIVLYHIDEYILQPKKLLLKIEKNVYTKLDIVMSEYCKEAINTQIVVHKNLRPCQVIFLLS